MKNTFAIIEIGSNNTKTHIYEEGKVVYENNTTIEFKKNYQLENKIMERRRCMSNSSVETPQPCCIPRVRL